MSARSAVSWAVHEWPGSQAEALAALGSNAGATVVSVPTEPTASRTEARAAIRLALQCTVAAFMGCPVDAVALQSRPGHATRVSAPGAAGLHVSISHMPGLSLAAISTRGAVGVDVMALAMPHWPDWADVAHDYLGPLAATALDRTLPAERPAAFARAWTALEARLKCLSLGLTEWTPALDACLNTCSLTTLTLPAGVCGAVAVLALQQPARTEPPLTPPASSAGTGFH